MAFCGCETTADLKPKKMDWPTQQSFLTQGNPTTPSRRVSVHLYTFPQFVCAEMICHEAGEGIERIQHFFLIDVTMELP